jgi:hypothetical protein
MTRTAVCFYISDFGYGHATRQVAIIRRFLTRAPGAGVYVKNDVARDFLRQALPQEVSVVRQRNEPDLELYRPDVDRAAREHAVQAWVDRWGEDCREEEAFCRRHGIGLLVSDAPPQPFVTAHGLGIPSLAVTNFFWDAVFATHVGPSPAVDRMRDAYRLATSVCRLPFEIEMPAGGEVGLVARPVGRRRTEIRRSLGVGSDEPLVFFSAGRSLAIDEKHLRHTGDQASRRGVRILTSARTDASDVLAVPLHDGETQDYVAACDLVVAKAGYGTISEAVQARVPLLLFDNPVEGTDMVDQVERLGIGGRISADAFLDSTWIARTPDPSASRRAYANLPERLARDGTDEVVDEIVRLAGIAA